MQELWQERAEVRAELCRRYLLGEDKIFHDYDISKSERTDTVSVASFYPMYFGMLSEDEARSLVNRVLPILETDHGILTCERMDHVRGNFQWGYPNGWPPMQIIAVGGLLRYGYTEDARRVAAKFLSLIEKCFRETEHLWEKYDVVEGSANALAEYETPAMLGWTYGAYRYLGKILSK